MLYYYFFFNCFLWLPASIIIIITFFNCFLCLNAVRGQTIREALHHRNGEEKRWLCGRVEPVMFLLFWGGGGGGGWGVNLFLFYGSVRQGACCDIANSSTMTRESNDRFTNCFPISPDCCRLLVLSDVEGALLRTLRLRLKDLCGGKLMFAEINRGCGGGWGRVTIQLSNKVKFYGISFSKFLELIILCQDLNQSKLTSVRFLLSFFLFYYH